MNSKLSQAAYRKYDTAKNKTISFYRSVSLQRRFTVNNGFTRCLRSWEWTYGGATAFARSQELNKYNTDWEDYCILGELTETANCLLASFALRLSNSNQIRKESFPQN